MGTNKKTMVLIVDDDLNTCETLSDIFILNNFQTLTAHNGKDGLALMQKHQVDIAMLDIRLPDIEGLELLEGLKKIGPDLITVFMTGYASVDYVKRALNQGANGFFVKPLVVEEILHVIKEALEKLSLARQVEKRTEEILEKNKQIEQEIEHRKVQEALLFQAKQEWERTIDAMPDMIAIVDRNHRIVRVNRPMLEKLGTSYDEFVGEKCHVCAHNNNAPPQYCPHSMLLEDGKEHRAEIFEKRLGGHCEIIVVPYCDSDGTIVGSVHIVRDINEQKKAAREKEKMHAQLLHAQKLESVGQLASGIAHEINTPTQFIGSNIDFLHDGFKEIADMISSIQSAVDGFDKTVAARLQEIFEEADWDYLAEEIPHAINQTKDGVSRVASIVSAMKEFSHPGSKTKGPADLNHIIETTITVARNEWKYVAKMETDFDPEMPNVLCLIDEMGQVLLILLVNAAHAIENKLGKNPEGDRGVISIQTRQVEGMAVLRIRDSGTGISPQIQSRIFDPFFTTKVIGKGTGQGLAIARDVIVEKHNGTIEVESEPGQGTTFIIQLPLNPEESK